MTTGTKIAVAVLAGGDGSRIGGGKPLINLGGKLLIERALERAGSWSDTTTLSLRSPDQTGARRHSWIADAPGIEGPVAGLIAVLEWAKREGAGFLLTIPCDMPFLPVDLPRRFIAEISGKNAAIAASAGHLHPVCGLWRTEMLEPARAYCEAGGRSLRGLAQRLGYVAVEWPAATRDPFFNINSLADLATAESMLDT